ncbi:MAG: hypothetical protein E5Y29_27285, partial [Mesorhizobium sp.]
MVVFSAEMAALEKELKAFLYKHLYRHAEVMRVRADAEQIAKNLFDAYFADPRAMPTGQNPRALAERLAQALRDDKDVAATEVAGPGFVNLRLKDGFWQAHLTALLGEGRNYGRSTVGGGRMTNVEYVSAHPRERRNPCRHQPSRRRNG